jgi:hypothetical protein
MSEGICRGRFATVLGKGYGSIVFDTVGRGTQVESYED